MESSIINEAVIIFALDAVLCFGLFTLWILPKFNDWPPEDKNKFNGKPRDYIHDSVFRPYAEFYFFIYVIIAFAVTQISKLRAAFTEINLESLFNDGIVTTLITTLLQLPMLFPYLLLLVVLANMIIPLSRTDQRGRSALLKAARIPKEALSLMEQIQQGLNNFDLKDNLLQNTFNGLENDGDGEFWQSIRTNDAQTNSKYACGQNLVKCFYLVELNRNLTSDYPYAEDINHWDRRLKEIASVLPNLDEQKQASTIQSYNLELEEITKNLNEMLARSHIKIYADENERKSLLSKKGFPFKFVDCKDLHLREPALWMMSSALIVCVLSVVIFLALFDGLAIKPPGDSKAWFEFTRIVGWSIGGSVSYIVAVMMGLFINEALVKQNGEKSIATYLFAFILATLGSLIFFSIARENFKAPHIWLAVNFGLLAIAVVASRGKNLTTRTQVRSTALLIALVYGLASGLLQIAIRVSFAAHHMNVSILDVPFSELSLTSFFMFGFLRGLAIAFLVSCILLEFECRYNQHSRRTKPRVSFDDIIESKLGGQPHTVMVKNLSENGALLRLSKGVKTAKGDHVQLDFPFGEVHGQILDVQGREVRVGFKPIKTATETLHQYVQRKMGITADLAQEVPG